MLILISAQLVGNIYFLHLYSYIYIYILPTNIWYLYIWTKILQFLVWISIFYNRKFLSILQDREAHLAFKLGFHEAATCSVAPRMGSKKHHPPTWRVLLGGELLDWFFVFKSQDVFFPDRFFFLVQLGFLKKYDAQCSRIDSYSIFLEGKGK